MPLPAPKFREIVFQLLYSYDLGRPSLEEMCRLLSQELQVPKSAIRAADERVMKLLAECDAIDALIGTHCKGYAFDRIQTVERNILRLGVYELLYDESLPPKVALAEAMRLTRKFGTKEAATFVNAILDVIYKTSHGEACDSKELEHAATELSESEKIAEEAAKNGPAKNGPTESEAT